MYQAEVTSRLVLYTQQHDTYVFDLRAKNAFLPDSEPESYTATLNFAEKRMSITDDSLSPDVDYSASTAILAALCAAVRDYFSAADREPSAIQDLTFDVSC